MAAALADAPQGVRILYPAGRSACEAGPLRVVVATPLGTSRLAATLDGKPVALQRLTFADTWVLPGKLKATAERVGDRSAAALWVAQLDLKPGRHTLAAGGQKVQVCAGKAPAGWASAYAHKPAGTGKTDCAGCHEMEGAALGAARTPKACASCHDEASVQLIHKHVAEPLARCAMCHDPHGAARPKLLVDAKEKLCSKCHESGHSKE